MSTRHGPQTVANAASRGSIIRLEGPQQDNCLAISINSSKMFDFDKEHGMLLMNNDINAWCTHNNMVDFIYRPLLLLQIIMFCVT